MSKWDAIVDAFTSQTAPISVWGFALNLVLAGILASILAYLYIHYGVSLSNRRMFAKNFIIISMTTTIIITIIKSSLALSLGLVGALSIVRFRAAIKEPEELSYLFLAIAIGVGMGADQRLITLIGFTAISALIIMKKKSVKEEEYKNLHLSIIAPKTENIGLEDIISTLKKHCRNFSLKRFEETEKEIESLFVIELESTENLIELKESFSKLNEKIKITFLDSGIF